MIVLAFYSTNYTLLAEKYMKDNNIETMIIPTPRIITRSCGMSIKISKSDVEKIKEVLFKHKVQVLGLFEIEEKRAKKIWENNI